MFLKIISKYRSRFDLFFVVLDECNELSDLNLASHIVNLHVNRENAISTELFNSAQIQRFIRFARMIKPEFTREAAQTLKEAYVALRH
jgi:DNA replication licensing factor MCM6